MEIGSIDGMQQGMSMSGLRRPPGEPSEDAEDMSTKIVDEQDTNEDGLLSAEELGEDSDVIANLDEDGDGLLSQSELQSGLQAKMEEAQSSFESGTQPSAENREFMEQMQSLTGMTTGEPAQASQTYAAEQSTTTTSEELDLSSSSYDQLLLDGLNLTI